MQCGCFNRGHKNIDSRIRNKVSSPWCHGCSWDCVSPLYWLHADYDTSFPKHLAVIKIIFYFNKTQLLGGVETFVPKVFNASDLDSQ